MYIYIYVYRGRWMLRRGAWHMGNRDVEEGMVGEGVGWCLRNGGWNGWE